MTDVRVVATSWPSNPDTAENEPHSSIWTATNLQALVRGDEFYPFNGVVIFKEGYGAINAEVAIFEHKGEIHTTMRARPGQEEALRLCVARAAEFIADNAHPHDREELGIKVMPCVGLPTTSWSGSNCYAGTIKEVQRNGRALVWISSQGHEDTYTLRADGEYRRKGNHSGSLCLGDNRKTDLCREQ